MLGVTAGRLGTEQRLPLARQSLFGRALFLGVGIVVILADRSLLEYGFALSVLPGLPIAGAHPRQINTFTAARLATVSVSACFSVLCVVVQLGEYAHGQRCGRVGTFFQREFVVVACLALCRAVGTVTKGEGE